MQFLRARTEENKLELAAGEIIAIDKVSFLVDHGLLLEVTIMGDGSDGGTYMAYRDADELFKEWELLFWNWKEVKYGRIKGID